MVFIILIPGSPEPQRSKNRIRLLKQAKELGKSKMVYKVNDIRHQSKNSECGVYCINFIVEMLKGKSFDEYVEDVIKDMQMNEKRDIYFSPIEYHLKNNLKKFSIKYYNILL